MFTLSPLTCTPISILKYEQMSEGECLANEVLSSLSRAHLHAHGLQPHRYRNISSADKYMQLAYTIIQVTTCSIIIFTDIQNILFFKVKNAVHPWHAHSLKVACIENIIAPKFVFITFSRITHVEFYCALLLVVIVCLN